MRLLGINFTKGWLCDAFDGDRQNPARIANPDAAPWEQYTGLSEEDSVKILSTGLPPYIEIKPYMRADGTAAFVMKDTLAVQEIEDRAFDIHKKIALPGNMFVTTQQQGIGRTIMRNEIEFFVACGLQRFDIFATSDVGGYAWARFGFLPSRTDNLKEELEYRFKVLKPLMNADEQKQVEKLIRLKDPKDLWRLADLRVNMMPRIDSMRDTVDRMIDLKTLPSVFLPLGALMLKGLEWDGYLDFKDKEQMKRVETYVGGWASFLKQAPKTKGPGLFQGLLQKIR